MRVTVKALLGVMVVIAGMSGLAFGQQLEATPYLQDVTKDSVVVRWITSQSQAGMVKYGLEGRMYRKAMEAKRDFIMHEVPLTGLDAGKRYQYEVKVDGKTYSGIFRTAPEAGQSFTFTVWGDSRTYPDKAQTVAEGMAKERPDLAVHVGDIAGSGKDYQVYKREFFNPCCDLFTNTPFFVAVGNHEYGGDPNLTRFLSILTQPGNERYFAATYGNARFVIMDSVDSTSTDGKELDWLKKELASKEYQEAEFHFLFLHHAPFCWDWYGGEKRIEEAIVPLAEQYNIDIFFGGHFHCYERGKRTHDGHDTYYVVTGGGGAEFTEGWGEGAPKGKPREFMTVHDWRYQYCLVKVEGKTLEFVAKDNTGKLMDQFTITHQ